MTTQSSIERPAADTALPASQDRIFSPPLPTPAEFLWPLREARFLARLSRRRRREDREARVVLTLGVIAALIALGAVWVMP